MAAQTKTKQRKMTTYFKGVKSEMKKVVWPTKKELLNYTAVVVALSAFVALIVWILDVVIGAGLSFIIK